MGDFSFQTAINSDECKNTYNYSIEHFKAEELYNENGLKVVSAALMKNKDSDRALLLEAVNTSSEQINLVTKRIGINGLLVRNANLSYDTINPEKTCIIDVKLSDIMRDSYWDIYGIKEIGELALDIETKRADDSVINEAKTKLLPAAFAERSYIFTHKIMITLCFRITKQWEFSPPKEVTSL